MSSNKIPPISWKECTSEEVLFNIVSEMQRPIELIMVSCQLLLEANLSAKDRVQMINSIIHNTKVLDNIREATREYTNNLK